MPIYGDTNIETTIHDFKTNISKYIRLLERGDYKTVKVHRYSKLIGVFLTKNSVQRFEKREYERIEALKRNDDVKYIIENQRGENPPEPSKKRTNIPKTQKKRTKPTI